MRCATLLKYLQELPTLREASYTVAHRERDRKCLKALLLGEKGGDEGKLVAHYVINER
jgi:hypothetical protein